MKNARPSLHALHPAAAALCLALLGGCAPSSWQGPSVPPTAAPTPRPTSAAPLLMGHHWRLVHVQDAQGHEQAGWKPTGPGVEGRYVQLDFTNEGMLSVQNLCNQLAGRYTIDGSRILVEQVISSMRACANRPLMELEQRVANRLTQIASWQLHTSTDAAPPTLTLVFQDAGRWELQGQPTPATLYGSPGTREFLEVAPQRESCTGVAPRQCLKVRKVQYDSRGLKTEVGPWELFYSDIEGYRHEPGVRNILRVQRYERRNVPADASRYVYLLDMVVESETVANRR